MTDGTAVSGAELRGMAAALAFPRYPATPGDDRAIEHVSEALARTGCEVRREEFSYDLGPVWWLLRSMLASAAIALTLATWLVREHAVVAVVVLAGTLAAGISLLGWFPWLERLYARPGPTKTANVEGLRRADAGPVVLLVAHHDSKSQNLTMLQRGLLTVVALLSVVAVLVTGALLALDAIEPPSNALLWLIGGAGVVSLGVLSTLRSGNESPGAVDNAGSVAVLLALARSLPPAVGERAELRFLSTGAEEDHMIGAMRYLERHFPDGPGGRDVWVINLDGAGSPGRVVLLERYGFGRWFSRRLSALARQEAAALGLAPRGVLMPPAMGIDAIPFAHRGLPCLTLASGSLGRATLAVHSARDRPENIDAEMLEAVYRLAYRMVLRLTGA